MTDDKSITIRKRQKYFKKEYKKIVHCTLQCPMYNLKEKQEKLKIGKGYADYSEEGESKRATNS